MTVRWAGIRGAVRSGLGSCAGSIFVDDPIYDPVRHFGSKGPRPQFRQFPTHPHLFDFVWGCSGTGPKAPEAGPLATDGLGLEELGVCGGSSSFAHTPPARVRTCAALGYYRSFLSHGRTPLWPAADRRACPRCARPKEGRVGRCRRKGVGGRGSHLPLPRSLVECRFTRLGWLGCRSG